MEYWENALGTADFEALQKIALAVLQDGYVDESEIDFLRKWLNDGVRKDRWPFSVLNDRLDEALEDGLIDECELRDITHLLIELSGEGYWSSVYSMTRRLPFNLSADVKIKDKVFVFTGKSMLGSRRKCKEMVEERGGFVDSAITFTRTDYLVYGVAGSDQYSEGVMGNKLIDTLGLQSEKDRQKPIYIVTEEMFAEALKVNQIIGKPGARKRELHFSSPIEVTFSYNDARRTVVAECIKLSYSGWKLYGFCKLRNSERTFCLDRLESDIEANGARYTPDEWVDAVQARLQ